MTRVQEPEPPRIAALPHDKHGRPVPWFCAWVDGQPEFRVVRPGGVREALRCSLCWVCGRGYAGGEDRAFVIGPMCAVNHVSSEPPCHVECAVWSARNCPFLSTPNMTRREGNLPLEAVAPAGVMIRRNPGVALVWVTGYRSWKPRDLGDEGMLFHIGENKQAWWYAEGREATRDEAVASIESGVPQLLAIAEEEGDEALLELDAMVERALLLVPAA